MLPYTSLLTNCRVLLCLMLLASTTSFAQSKEKITIKPTDGELSSSIRNKVYYYPTFQKGKVVFISDVASTATLNYNMLSEEVEFINSKDDTLALDNMYTVKMVIMGSDTFYYDSESGSLLKLVDQIGRSQLLVREKYSLTDVKSVGAMGVVSSTKSPNSTTNSDFRNNQSSLKSNENLEFKAKSYYYLGTQSEYMPVTRANVLKMYPEHADKLKDYIKENKLDMKSEEEIKQVLQYASTL